MKATGKPKRPKLPMKAIEQNRGKVANMAAQGQQKVQKNIAPVAAGILKQVKSKKK